MLCGPGLACVCIEIHPSFSPPVLMNTHPCALPSLPTYLCICVRHEKKEKKNPPIPAFSACMVICGEGIHISRQFISPRPGGSLVSYARITIGFARRCGIVQVSKGTDKTSPCSMLLGCTPVSAYMLLMLDDSSCCGFGPGWGEKAFVLMLHTHVRTCLAPKRGVGLIQEEERLYYLVRKRGWLDV